MFRFIVIISILITTVFVFSWCSSQNTWEDSSELSQSFEWRLKEALVRHTPDTHLSSITFSLEDFFWKESAIYQHNQAQISMKQMMQDRFDAVLSGEETLYFPELSDEALEQQLQKHRQRSSSNIQANWTQWLWWDHQFFEADCAGIILDPCLKVWLQTETDVASTLYDNIIVYPEQELFDTTYLSRNT